MTVADPTPIPAAAPPTADARYGADVLTEMGIEPYISGGKWRFEVDEVQMMALIIRVYGDGIARGLAAGRTAAAADVRALISADSGRGAWAMARLNALSEAARIAESGDNR